MGGRLVDIPQGCEVARWVRCQATPASSHVSMDASSGMKSVDGPCLAFSTRSRPVEFRANRHKDMLWRSPAIWSRSQVEACRQAPVSGTRCGGTHRMGEPHVFQLSPVI